MGFKNGAYATVWSVESKFNTLTRVRISINRKDKQSGEYEQDFGGYVDFVGTANAHAATRLNEKDRIKLGDVDVTTSYDKEKKISYTNFKVFSFEPVTSNSGNSTKSNADQPDVDNGEAPDLPF